MHFYLFFNVVAFILDLTANCIRPLCPALTVYFTIISQLWLIKAARKGASSYETISTHFPYFPPQFRSSARRTE